MLENWIPEKVPLSKREIWKDIPGYKGHYKVSNLGRVKSIKRVVQREGQIGGLTINERILKPIINKGGYHILYLSINGQKKTFLIHRAVAMTFLKNKFNKSDVNHIDGNKTNNSVKNLEWATSLENAKHAVKLGLNRPTRGCSHPLSKWTNDQVLAVKTLLENRKHSYLEIEKRTGVSFHSIAKIKEGKLRKLAS